MGPVDLEKRTFKGRQCFFAICNYLALEKGVAHLPKYALCQIWLTLA